MTKTLVIGFNGQLATELRKLKENDPSFVFVGRDQLDAAKAEDLRSILTSVKPTTVINCTAYAAFDLAETHVAECKTLNTDFVRRLSQESADRDFHLVHFSTDYVFEGKSQQPYVESDECKPLSVYGLTKREGEIAAMEWAKSATVVRTAWLYSSSGHNFLKTMLRLGREGNQVRVVDDQRGCPTWTCDLAKATIEQFSQRTDSNEIYHFAGGGDASWYEFAATIFADWKLPVQPVPIKTSEFPAAAQRPAYSVLSKDKFESKFGSIIPDWRESLERCQKSWELF